MDALASKVSENKKPLFMKDVTRILIIQICYQVFLSLIFYLYPPFFEVKPVVYFNYSAYFFIFNISAVSLKYTLANRILVYLFVIQFFYLSIHDLLLYVNVLYNIQHIINYSFLLLITLYLFFYSIAPNTKKQYKPLVSAIILTLIVIGLVYSNIVIFMDYQAVSYDDYNRAFNDLNLNTYFVNVICLSFMLFVWFTYNQGQYLLSEYLPAILAIFTLMIVNEVYQLYNYSHLINNYIDGQYFNGVINIGFIIVWLVRLNYLSDPASIKKEKFILNYDLLKGYVEKPHNELWDTILVKLGKQKLFFGSFILFGIICIPLIIVGDISFFSRFNIILMLFFLVSVMIYAIIYTQRKWFNHIGFLIKEKQKK
jgi:multisubunit Na+/H+ antiporter MnhC subunit